MTDISQMIQKRSELNDELEHVRRLARLLQEPDRELAHLGRGIVELGDQQSERPLVRFCRGEDELAEVFGRVQSDMLPQKKKVKMEILVVFKWQGMVTM